MKNLNIEVKENKKGITLVALVVTIVVLLILAGVSLNLLIGNNGIITRAKQAKISNDLSSYKEQLAMFIADKKTENPEFYESSLTAGKNNLYYNTKTSEDEKTIKDIIKDVKDEYLDSLEVVKGKLTVNTKDKNIIKVAQAVGVEPNPYDIRDGVLQSSDGNLLLMDENGTLTIPDSVVTIGSGAFSGVTGLKTIIIPGTVKTISTSAFAFNTTLETVVIEEGVQIIGQQAFNGCSNLRSINLPQSLTKIGHLAFYDCKKIERVTIPRGVRDIGNYVFANCTLLADAVFENGNDIVSDSCFTNCSNLRKVTIPSTVQTINSTAFNNCLKLDEINLEDNQSYVFDNGILKTADGTKIVFMTNGLLANISTFEIPNGVTNFGMNIGLYTNIKQINIPSTLESLGAANKFPKSISNVIVDENNTRYASENGILYTKDDKTLIMCYLKEKDINIQEGILTLNAYCFKQAENAENIILPESLQTISSSALRENNKFNKILIGKNVSSISPMFKLTNYAGTVEISEENPYYTIENNILYSKDKKTLICALYQITGSFTVPGTVENIGNLAFDAQGMQEVILESGVKKIDSAAFSQCSNLKKITIPDTVTNMGEDLFERCNNLESIVIDNKEGAISGVPWGAPKGMRAITWEK
ncbi:MAG: leucine-rich repeat protein [Clostridia bacterium]